MNLGKISYYDGNLSYFIDHIDYLNVTREDGVTNTFPKGKAKHTLLFTAAGQMQYTFGVDIPPVYADAGCLCFIPKAQSYTSIYTGNKTTVNILQFEVAAGSLPSCFSAPQCIQSSSAAAVINDLHSFTPGNATFLAAKVYELLWIMEKQNRILPDTYIRILPALKAMEQHYAQNQKIAYYANLCNMSESNFRKVFHACVGKSPIEHRNMIRLHEAKKMILSGEYSVEEAAHTVGFHNMSFFYQLYKKIR